MFAAASTEDPPACAQQDSTGRTSERYVNCDPYTFLRNATGNWKRDQSEPCSLRFSFCCVRELKAGVNASNCMEELKGFGFRILRNVWFTKSENALTYVVEKHHALILYCDKWDVVHAICRPGSEIDTYGCVQRKALGWLKPVNIKDGLRKTESVSVHKKYRDKHVPPLN